MFSVSIHNSIRNSSSRFCLQPILHCNTVALKLPPNILKKKKLTHHQKCGGNFEGKRLLRQTWKEATTIAHPIFKETWIRYGPYGAKAIFEESRIGHHDPLSPRWKLELQITVHICNVTSLTWIFTWKSISSQLLCHHF